MHGDCNRILLDEVLPEVRYEQYCRGLCILDPYGLHLNWEVIAKTGSMKSIEIFLNFPVADINRKVLWRDPLGVSPDDVGRMNAYWGDESWRNIAYTPSAQRGLFGHTEMEKADNEVIAEAFRKRLKQVAGFRYVPKPLPMRNRGTQLSPICFSHRQTGREGRSLKESSIHTGTGRDRWQK
jgi:three-Cys-motif partner protein